MVTSVVREHHWPPDIMGGLYFDYEDHFGLEYWYLDVKESNDEVKKKTDTPK